MSGPIVLYEGQSHLLAVVGHFAHHAVFYHVKFAVDGLVAVVSVQVGAVGEHIEAVLGFQAVGDGYLVVDLESVHLLVLAQIVVGEYLNLGESQSRQEALVVLVQRFARFLGLCVDDAGAVHAAGRDAQHHSVIVLQQLRHVYLLQETVLGGHVSPTKDDEVALPYQFLGMGCRPAVEQFVALKLHPRILEGLAHAVGAVVAECGIVGVCGDEKASYGGGKCLTQIIVKTVGRIDGAIHRDAWAAGQEIFHLLKILFTICKSIVEFVCKVIFFC